MDETAFGPEIAADGEHPERGDYQEPLLSGRLQNAIARINRDLPPRRMPKPCAS